MASAKNDFLFTAVNKRMKTISLSGTAVSYLVVGQATVPIDGLKQTMQCFDLGHLKKKKAVRPEYEI